jgi:hypothetical protein
MRVIHSDEPRVNLRELITCASDEAYQAGYLDRVKTGTAILVKQQDEIQELRQQLEHLKHSNHGYKPDSCSACSAIK